MQELSIQNTGLPTTGGYIFILFFYFEQLFKNKTYCVYELPQNSKRIVSVYLPSHLYYSVTGTHKHSVDSFFGTITPKIAFYCRRPDL